MNELNNYELRLLNGWEEVYKKGQLPLLIFLSLKDGSKHMAAIKEFIVAITHGTITVDDKSMYRALRRYYDAELIDFEQVPGQGGPERKVYHLTEMGDRLTAAFIARNILGVFYQSKMQEVIEKDT